MKRYTIESDFLSKNFSNTELTFYVEKMRADDMAMVRPYLKLFNGKTNADIITTLNSDWWVVGSEYDEHSFKYTITEEQLNATAFFKVGMIVDGMHFKNKLYFNHMQLAEGDVTSYHQPVESIPKTDIKFTSNFYANFYTTDDDRYLQVIRPYYNNMDTETITRSKVTVLAPHLMNEDDIDSPSNIGLEFMNSYEQVIEILR